MVTDEILRLKANASEEELKLESKTIVGTYVAVIENSDDDFFWVGCSQMNSFSLFENYSPLVDREIIRLCSRAINEAERHSDNLESFVSELETKVNEGIPLEHEYNEIAYGGPMTDELGKSLEAWSKEHEGFSKKKLREDEFILGYCRALMKGRDNKAKDSNSSERQMEETEIIIPIPMSIRNACNDGYLQETSINGKPKFINRRTSMKALVKDLHRKYGDKKPTQQDIREFVVKKNGEHYGDSTISEAFTEIRKSSE